MNKKNQHMYEISSADGVEKTGKSGSRLNQNGTSKRANSQVNKLNKQAGSKKYTANVVQKDISGRSAALKAEQANTTRLYQQNNPMSIHSRPKPQ